MFIVAQTFMALLDISFHAAMIKILKSNSQTSIIIGYAQTSGILLGGLILLKLTSKEFASSIGLAHPIMTTNLVLLIFGLLIFVPVILIHFKL